MLLKIDRPGEGPCHGSHSYGVVVKLERYMGGKAGQGIA